MQEITIFGHTFLEHTGEWWISNIKEDYQMGCYSHNALGPQELIYRMNIYDEIIDVEALDAYAAARKVAKADGVLLGESSGAAIYAATQVAKRPENKGKRIVVISADSGLRYLSTALFGE